MSTARNPRTLAPISLVEDAIQLDLRTFLASHGDAMFLLVRIPEGDTELELGLSTLNTGTSLSAITKPMPFHTTHQATPGESRRRREPRREDPAALGRRIDKDAYFAMPVQKRGDSDATFMARISIGRAPNKDIVLRHASISKFHAWFEMSNATELCVCDAGSTNLTHVNGRPLEPRATVAVDGGDEIRFGAVETVLSSPEGLWTCLNADKRGESIAMTSGVPPVAPRRS